MAYLSPNGMAVVMMKTSAKTSASLRAPARYSAIVISTMKMLLPMNVNHKNNVSRKPPSLSARMR
jgi:hypothetical protein